MHEIFVIHLRLHLKEEIRSGYVGNQTVITPKLDIRKIDDDKLDEEFDDVVFFLSRRYGESILNKLRKDVTAQYKNAQVDYDLVKKNISQRQLDALMVNRWEYEKA